MVYIQLVYVIGIVAILPCMGYPAPGEPVDGVSWTYFASPPIQHFFYSIPLRVFRSSYDYPGRNYEMWGPANMPSLWDAAPTDRTPKIETATSQQEASTEKHKRSKRFLPHLYGGMPGITMGGYGTGMTSASASAMASGSYGSGSYGSGSYGSGSYGSGSYGSYGYPFFG